MIDNLHTITMRGTKVFGTNKNEIIQKFLIIIGLRKISQTNGKSSVPNLILEEKELVNSLVRGRKW